jgi:hypothetical protein
MRRRIIDNIAELNIKKQTINPNDYNLLMNSHQYSLSLLNNMLSKRIVYQNDPYEPTYNLHRNYKRKGWERQFDQALISNPMSYTLPPMNVWRTDLAKKM